MNDFDPPSRTIPQVTGGLSQTAEEGEQIDDCMLSTRPKQSTALLAWGPQCRGFLIVSCASPASVAHHRAASSVDHCARPDIAHLQRTSSSPPFAFSLFRPRPHRRWGGEGKRRGAVRDQSLPAQSTERGSLYESPPTPTTPAPPAQGKNERVPHPRLCLPADGISKSRVNDKIGH